MECFGVIFTAALLLFSFCFLLCLLCALGLSQSRSTFLLGSKPTVFKLALTGRSFLPRERFFGPVRVKMWLPPAPVCWPVCGS